MTTPAGVHWMGRTTRIRGQPRSAGWRDLSEVPTSSRGGQMAEATCSDEKAGEKYSVVAKMHEIARRHGAGSGSDVSENNADAAQQTDLPPGAAELPRIRNSHNPPPPPHPSADAP